jgi:putative redox protein
MKITFENATGRALSAQLEMPADGQPIAYALFAHCFTCSKDLKAAVAISRALCQKGIATLRFDFTGLGQSEGTFADTTFSTNVDDLVAAADYLADQHEAPRLLVGHSLGGAAVLKAAGRLKSVRAVATVAAPVDPVHTTHLFDGSLDEIRETGQATVTLAGRSFTVRKELLDDLAEQKTREAIRSLDRALLIFHAPLDNTVGIENATEIFKAARHPKSYVSLDEADHLLTDRADAEYVGEVTAAWAARYVGAPQSEQKETAPDDNHVTARTAPGGLFTEITANGHALLADEPTSIPGGTNRGPTPYDHLAAALASCTSMTLRMYADRKEWPIGQAITRVQHETIHADDCAHCATKEGKLDRLTRTVEVTGDLSDEQRERLVEIANKCPVHRTLEGEIDVMTHLGE